MNETLDVLRYWLSEWRFFPPDGKLYTSLGFITGEGLRGNVCRTMDTDHLCAELRRKYLEREEVWLVESVANKKPEGSSVSPFVTVIEMSHGACYIGPGDSELSATIAAGKALMDALCGGGK